MRSRPRALVAVLGVLGLLACLTPSERPGAPRSTLVIGVDVSGSFRHEYNDAIDFAAHYLYGHLNGLGDLAIPSAVFVGSVGGERPGETKSFQPIHSFQGKSVEELSTYLRELFTAEDAYTDFNAFFDRVATQVKRRNLTLAPLNIVILSDGVPDDPAAAQSDDPYSVINLDALEYLSRSVTVRVLYPSPSVAVNWERRIPRQRVRMWTVDAPVMHGWREQLITGVAIEEQEDLWRWVHDNVDFRVRSRRL